MTNNLISVNRDWVGVKCLATWPQDNSGVPNEIGCSVLRVASSFYDWCVQLSVFSLPLWFQSVFLEVRNYVFILICHGFSQGA